MMCGRKKESKKQKRRGEEKERMKTKIGGLSLCLFESKLELTVMTVGQW